MCICGAFFRRKVTFFLDNLLTQALYYGAIMAMKGNGLVEFGNDLRERRKQAGCSVRGLAKKARMSFALLTCIENARRGAGRFTLERLGRALGLEGDDFDEFVLDGLVISKREKLLGSVQGYPARVLNALPMALRCFGIVPGGLASCEKVLDNDSENGLLLRLNDGSKVKVTIRISKV
jgi:transcriptional regulator with XRE-family HTH domain